MAVKRHKRLFLMPHYLMNRTKDDGKLHSYDNPLMVSMRYRCDCANNEVLQISVVIDKDTDEEVFTWTMKRLLKDMKIEIKQHTNEK